MLKISKAVPFVLVATAVAALVTVPAARGQQRGRASMVAHQTAVATSVISPVVVAQWFTTRGAGAEELALLVLWRGAPGWFLQPGGSGSSGSTNNVDYTWIKYGDVSLSLDFDAAARTVTLQGTPLALLDNNVLLVDDVDGTNGPRVVSATAVPRRMPGAAGQIAPILRGSPAMMSFLRCDAGRESPRRALLETLCLQNVGADR
jgi:hypothetical protein